MKLAKVRTYYRAKIEKDGRLYRLDVVSIAQAEKRAVGFGGRLVSTVRK